MVGGALCRVCAGPAQSQEPSESAAAATNETRRSCPCGTLATEESQLRRGRQLKTDKGGRLGGAPHIQPEPPPDVPAGLSDADHIAFLSRRFRRGLAWLRPRK